MTKQKSHQKSKKTKWKVFLIYGLFFLLSLYGKNLNKRKLTSLEKLSATALMLSEPKVDNWIADKWDYRHNTFEILYLSSSFVPMIKKGSYSGGGFYNVTTRAENAKDWYCSISGSVPADVKWAFPKRLVSQYCS